MNDAGKSVWGFLSGNVEHPAFVILFSGLIAGWIVFPTIYRIATWTHEWEKFKKGRNEAHKVKGDFHSLLNQAYSVWQNTKLDAPTDLDSLIEQTQVPDKKALLSNDTGVIHKCLFKSNQNLWLFCRDLYADIEASRRRQDYEPKYLNRNDCVHFSESRKTLTSFWNDVGEKVSSINGLLFKKIWLYKMKSDIKDRSMKILPFLETALAQELKHETPKAKYLFRLSEYGYRKWHAVNT